MGKKTFRGRDSFVVAHWGRTGEAAVDRGYISPHDAPAFIEWLQDGPPKPQYRITELFFAKPVRVTTGWGDGERYHHLKDADIEEVPCSG